MRETRVFTGFSRIVPVSPGDEKIKLSKEPMDWLPAVEIRGEGIFLEFNFDNIDDWAKSFKSISLSDNMDAKIKNASSQSKPNLTRRNSVSDKFLLVHTFSHLFIRQLSFDSGYDTSSMRERLFVGQDEKQK